MLYEIVKEAANERNVTFHKIETDLNLGNGSIAKWQNQAPSWDKVFAVAKYLKIPLSLLREAAEKENVKKGNV